MDILPLLNGTTIAFNPLSIVLMAMVGWVIGQVAQVKTETHDNLADFDKTLAVVVANQTNNTASIIELKAGQQRIMETMERHHNANIQTLFRQGGVRVLKDDIAALSQGDYD